VKKQERKPTTLERRAETVAQGRRDTDRAQPSPEKSLFNKKRRGRTRLAPLLKSLSEKAAERIKSLTARTTLINIKPRLVSVQARYRPKYFTMEEKR
jgi:hypothetical protein